MGITAKFIEQWLAQDRGYVTKHEVSYKGMSKRRKYLINQIDSRLLQLDLCVDIDKIRMLHDQNLEEFLNLLRGD